VGALFALELAAELKRSGQTLLDQLNALYIQHGYHLEETISTTCAGPTGQLRIRRIMAAFRERPPSTIAGCVWEVVRDYQQHEIRSLPSNRVVEQMPTPTGDLLIFQGRSRDCQISVAMRPSGTEPKIKFYYFIKTSTDIPLSEASSIAATCLSTLKSELELWMRDVE
jgi:phosphoglucomutase/phosphomannomutase